MDRRLVALLLEVGPSELVHRDAVERRLLELHRLLVGSRGAIQVVGAAVRIDLVEVPVSDLPPDFGDVARLAPSVRLLRDRRARRRVWIDVLSPRGAARPVAFGRAGGAFVGRSRPASGVRSPIRARSPLRGPAGGARWCPCRDPWDRSGRSYLLWQTSERHTCCASSMRSESLSA